jgi:hypothetical protein
MALSIAADVRIRDLLMLGFVGFVVLLAVIVLALVIAAIVVAAMRSRSR